MYSAILHVAVATSNCVSLIMVTITSHIFMNMFQMQHSWAVKLAMGCEKNVSFLAIPKSQKNVGGEWKIRQGSFKDLDKFGNILSLDIKHLICCSSQICMSQVATNWYHKDFSLFSNEFNPHVLSACGKSFFLLNKFETFTFLLPYLNSAWKLHSSEYKQA